MERAKRDELKALSTEILGGPNRYQKLVQGTVVESGQVAKNGKPIKVAHPMSEQEVLEMLRGIKKDQIEQEAARAVQKQAGGSVG
jgi:hypothetical protein